MSTRSPTRAALSLQLALLSVVLTSSVLGGCLRGDALKIATVAAVVAVKTAQVIAASSNQERRGRFPSAGAPAPRGGPCGVCDEPENGYALCFVSSCEVRCIEGYVLTEGRCVVAAPSR